MGGPLYAPEKEANFILDEVAEQHRLTYPFLTLYKRNRNVGSFDELYGEEEMDDLLSGTSYEIPAHRQLNPPAKQWEKWGITDVRDVYIRFSVQVLRDGFGDPPVQYPYVEVGDLVIILGFTYALTNVYRKEYFGNTEIPLNVHAFGVKVRDSWVSDTVDIDPGGSTLPPPDSGGDTPEDGDPDDPY